MSQQRNLLLKTKSTELSILIPSHLWNEAEELRSIFHSNEAEDRHGETRLELLLLFMELVKERQSFELLKILFEIFHINNYSANIRRYGKYKQK